MHLLIIIIISLTHINFFEHDIIIEDGKGNWVTSHHLFRLCVSLQKYGHAALTEFQKDFLEEANQLFVTYTPLSFSSSSAASTCITAQKWTFLEKVRTLMTAKSRLDIWV